LPFTFTPQISLQTLLQISAIACSVASQSYILWYQTKLPNCLLVSYHQLKSTSLSQINASIDHIFEQDPKSPEHLIEDILLLISNHN